MNKIYLEISKLSDKFREMSYGITQDKERIDDAVQELMLYFLMMNPETLKNIWKKDGKKGIIGYGAVVLKRALTSVRSPFFYKYEKYYTYIDNTIYSCSHTPHADNIPFNDRRVYKLQQIPEEQNEQNWQKLELIDKELDKLDYWYDKKIFELYYYEGNTLDSLAYKTKISRNSLFTTIDKVRNIIKKNLIDE